RRHTRFSRDWSSDVCSSDLLKLLTGPGCDAVAVVGVRVGTRERGQFGFGRLGAVTADLLGDVRGPNPLRVVGVVLVDRVERIVVGPVGAVRGLLPRVEVCGSDPAAVVFGGGTEQGEDVVVGDGGLAGHAVMPPAMAWRVGGSAPADWAAAWAAL